jgi:DNA-binding transcriptional LysR family regulator
MDPTPLAIGVAPQLLDALSLMRTTQAERTSFDPSTARRVYTVRTRDIGEAVDFPRLLADLSRSTPGIQLRTVFRRISETVNGMACGQIDLSVGFLPALEAGIHRRLMSTQRYVCVMRAGHPLAQDQLTVDGFAGSGHLLLERAIVEAGAGKRIRLRLPQYLSAPHFIVNSDLLWSVPALLAETLSKHYPLVVKPHPLELPEIEICVYWHERYHRDPANRWLRERIVQQFASRSVVTACADRH